MSLLNRACIGIGVLLLVFSLFLSVNAVQLFEDDGTMEESLVGSTGAFAVKMIPERTGKLTALTAFVERPGPQDWKGWMISYSMDNGHNIESQRLFHATPGFSWQTRDFLFGQEFSNEFYAGISKISSTSLGSDKTTPNSNSEFSNDYADPTGYSVDSQNNYMIRANFDYYPTVSNILTFPEPTNHSPTITATCTDYETPILLSGLQVDGNPSSFMIATDGAYDELIEEVKGFIPISALADGEHTVEVGCMDDSFNITKPLESATFFVDRVAPNTTVALDGTLGAHEWFTSNVQVTLTSTDPAPGSDVERIDYWLDGDTVQGLITCTTNPCVFTISNNGTTDIYFRATDNANNPESVQHASVFIDKTPPSAPVLIPFPEHYINGTSQTISWSLVSEALPESGVDYYNIYREVNDLGIYGLFDSTVATWVIDDTLAADHNYSYFVSAVDFAGNQSVPSESDWVVVDQNSPEASFLYALPAFMGSDTVHLDWDRAEDINTVYPAGIDYYSTYKNLAWLSKIDYTGAPVQSYDDIGNLDVETHSYEVSATDNANNEGPLSNTETTTIDLTPPVTLSIMLVPNGNNEWYITPETVTLSAFDPNSPSSGVATTYYCTDQTDLCTPNTLYTGPITVSAEGINFVRFYSVDNVGNIETTKSTGPIKIDLTNPHHQGILLDNGAAYNTTGNVMATLDIGFDDVSGLDYCEVSWDNITVENTGLNDLAGPYSYPDGVAIAQYKCFDIAGRETSPLVSDDIIVDTIPPVSDITSLVALEDVLKGNTLIAGNSFDATSGIDFIEIKIEQRDENDSGWNTILDWTPVNETWSSIVGNTEWNYLWNNSSYPTTSFRVSSRATDKAGWQETTADIQNDNIRIELIKNNSPYIENALFGDTDLWVYGFLDRTNWEYSLEIFDRNEVGSPTIYDYNIVTDDDAFFSYAIDASTWDLSKWYTARLITEEGQELYTQLDALYYSYQIELLNQQLQEIDANIAALWEDSNNQAQQIADLNAAIQDIYNQLDSINQQLADLESDVSYLMNKVDQLQGQIDFLFNVLKVMNHASINLFYNADAEALDVWGEAAYGTFGFIGLTLIPTDLSGPNYFYFTTVSGPNNSYHFTTINGNPIDTSILPPKSYNVNVTMFSDFRPMGAPPIYVVGAIFDTLAIEDLAEHLEELEEQVSMLNAGNLAFTYNSVTNMGTFHGEAPTNANCAKLSIFSSAGTFWGFGQTTVVEDGSGPDYSITKNLSNYPHVPLNVYVRFFENPFCMGFQPPIEIVNDTFDSLLAEDLFGFRNITASTYVTSYYINEIDVPITFGLKPVTGEHYRIEYRINPEEEWQTLKYCSYYPEGINTDKRAELHLDSTGIFRVQLRTQSCGYGPPATEEYISHRIRIKHVDLIDFLTAYTAIVNPVENSYNPYPSPYGSITPGVYWTQSGSVPLISYVGTNTEPDYPTCEVRYYSTDTQSHTIAEWDINSMDSNTWICDTLGELETSDWGNTNYKDGQFTRIRVRNDIVGQPDSFDEIKIGIDNTPPSITSINPDEEGILNGVYRVFADITDNLSGVKEANFFLIEKDGFEYCMDDNENCHFGDGNIVWTVVDVDFDSNSNMFYNDVNTLNFPDGDYNIAYQAIDVAGNEGYLEIDPIIDNTKPIINDVSFLPADPKLRGQTIEIMVIVTDNLSGVDQVWATITRPDTTVDVLQLTGTEPNYSGEYITDINFEEGNYQVQVNATDLASNPAILFLTDFNLWYSYVIDIMLTNDTVTQGDSLTINGTVLSDHGNIVGDANVDLLLPTETVTVTVDVNTGEFSYLYHTGSAPTGTHTIIAEVIAPNGITFSDSETLIINAPPTPPEPSPPSPGSPGNGGPSGGSSGALILEFSENCSNEEIVITILRETINSPVFGAIVTITNEDEEVIAEVTTNQEGQVSFNLEPGIYTFTAKRSIMRSNPQEFEVVDCTPVAEETPANTTPVPPAPPQTTETTETSTLTAANPNNTAPITGFLGLGATGTSVLLGALLIIGLAGISVGWRRFKA
ncbi:hypothetical protein KKE06_03485 [Candidatus Micrarchaeota archaeon]|nr:hypothetical protein [Candidatus Micrarchaeota archaeon]